MDEQIISFEAAKLAKEKGFNIPCTNMWYYNSKYEKKPKIHEQSTSHRRYVNCSEHYLGCNTSDYEESTITIKDLLKVPSDYPAEVNLFLAPTKSLLQKWLREIHNIDVSPICGYRKSKYYHLGIIFINSEGKVDSLIIKEKNSSFNKMYATYEEALEEGLKEGLKLIRAR